VCLIDPAQATITIVSAGHPPPLLVDSTHASFVDVVNAEPASFFPPERRPEAVTIAIPDGTALLLYTDGLVERRTESVDVGLRRLADHVGASRWATADDLCDAALDGALAGTDRRDDVCLLVVQLPAGSGLSRDRDETRQ